VVICNKQDLIESEKGRAGFIKKSISFYDSSFDKFPFVNASAVEGYGAQEALKILLKEIAAKFGWNR
jgi:signal recognition particle receptor subunit beta